MEFTVTIHDLIARHGIISDQITKSELQVILRECDQVLRHDVAGDIVELGCYAGTTSLYLQRLIQQTGRSRQLYVYDSFEGLPSKVKEDLSPAGEQFRAGELAVGKTALIRNFKHAGLPLPRIKKAWFSELTSDDIPARIAFAFLDGDFYESILDSLTLVWPKLTEGAVVVVDDYQTEALPGVRKALDVWARDHQFTLRVEASLAIIYR